VTARCLSASSGQREADAGEASARYTPQVEDKIRELGLSGKRVRATIEVEQDAIVSTANIRPAEYRLLDVEDAVT